MQIYMHVANSIDKHIVSWNRQNLIYSVTEDMTTLLANQRWLYKIADGLFFIHGGHWLIIAEKCLELLA